ncbi:MAG: hypothetical protein LBK70_02835 [Clostridiales bacterium]|nr:hypothetical protein [Clostridiales bacterium]
MVINTPIYNNSSSYQLRAKLDRLMHSKYWVVVCGTIAVIAHTFNLTTIGFGLFLCLGIYVLFTQRDLLPLVTCLAIVCYSISTQFVSNTGVVDNAPFVHLNNYIVFGCVFVLGILGLIAGSIYNYATYHRTLVKSKILLPTLLLCGAVLLSGLFSPYYFNTINWIAIAVFVSVSLYMLMLAYNASDKLDLDYVAKLILTIGIVACVQLLIYFALNIQDINRIISDKDINLGWSTHNGIGMLILICIPAAFYLAYKHTNNKVQLLYILVAIVMFLVQLTVLARSTMLFGLLTMPTLLAIFFFKTNRQLKIQLLILGATTIVCIAIMAYVLRQQIQVAWERLANLGLDDSDRFDWYRLALNLFGKYPVFGVGWGYDTSLYINGQPFMAIHNTPLQFLASTGIVGFGLATWLLMVKCKVLTRCKSVLHIFVIGIIVTTELLGLIEIIPFSPHMMMLLQPIVFAALELNPQRSIVYNTKLV